MKKNLLCSIIYTGRSRGSGGIERSVPVRPDAKAMSEAEAVGAYQKITKGEQTTNEKC